MPNYASSSGWQASGIGTSAISSGAASSLGSTVIANGTDLDLLMDVSVRLSSYTPGSNPYWELHLVPLLDDGSTYADRSAATLVDTLPVTTGASAKGLMFWGVSVPPGSYKLQLVNQSGASATPAADPQYRTYATG